MIKGVLLDEYLIWKKYIKDTKNEIAKNVGLIKARHYLNQIAWLILYYSFIRTYIHYWNVNVFFRASQKGPFLVSFFIGYYGYCFIKFVNSIVF